jgi:succinate-semialdehyde dehydrogenase/glutarate-semialdehyde dehydrogenase
VNRRAVKDVHQLVEASVAKGAKVILGGKPSDLGECFYEPTIMVDVTNDMPVAQQEIFGPVAPVMKFETEQEAIDIANDTDVGLASYIYTRDIGRCWRVAEALDYGMVGINEGIISNEAAPFGGVKESGQGREGSKYGIEDYVEIKYLCMGGLDS